MSPLMWPWSPLNVALRKESVDRNKREVIDPHREPVALRKESVDRNKVCDGRQQRDNRVALRKESVDRNSRGRDCG